MMMSDAFDAADLHRRLLRGDRRQEPARHPALELGESSGSRDLEDLSPWMLPLLDSRRRLPKRRDDRGTSASKFSRYTAAARSAGIDDEVQIVAYEAMKAAQS